MVNEGETNRGPTNREICMAARATIELFENGAVAKTKQRLLEVEADDDKQAIEFWRLFLLKLNACIEAATPIDFERIKLSEK